ncbi:MAG: hypothetical protein KKE73_07660 [Proteobacteria bacterium]|nr:hypothetical protein [Pseudomonadota bacterium]
MQYKIKGLIAACPESWSPTVSACGLKQDGVAENKAAPGSSGCAPEPGQWVDSQSGCLDEQWVVTRLVEVTLRCMQAVEPPSMATGSPRGDWKFDTNGAIRALTLLGKHLGMFSERVEHQVNVHEDALDELE